MKKNISDHIIALAVALMSISYIGYQAYNYYYNPYKTETVFTYTVSQNTTAQGVAVRQETLLEPVDGSENFLYEDGTKMAIGQVVAECYNDPVGSRNIRELNQLKSEIEMLQNAQDKTINNYSNTEALNREIKVQLTNFTKMTTSGWYSDAGVLRSQLTALINKKQIATGKVSSFESRIHVLQAEYDALAQNQVPDSTRTVTTPVAGYFVKNVDGYETMLNPQMVDSGTIETLIGFVEGDVPPAPTDAVGKMVTNANWYFICAIPRDTVEWVTLGQNVSMRFDVIGNTPIPAVVKDVISQRENPTAILVLRCNYVTSDLINLREAEVEINFRNHEGLKIDTADIRFVDNRQGVYILDENTVCFRVIDPIYEDQGFILSNPNSLEPNAVKKFDQIIRGNDLHDGKIIS
ncbi:HlyD family efflux transporter periplasmic adaptor subunit [Oscillospiraceae bacterium MB08-C2-2]|nr:HlyD family efflux transporter periplasmic adaptor subunit [Oscillospiraceae bacterium MB08-C2-2]